MKQLKKYRSAKAINVVQDPHIRAAIRYLNESDQTFFSFLSNLKIDPNKARSYIDDIRANPTSAKYKNIWILIFNQLAEILQKTPSKTPPTPTGAIPKVVEAKSKTAKDLVQTKEDKANPFKEILKLIEKEKSLKSKKRNMKTSNQTDEEIEGEDAKSTGSGSNSEDEINW